MSYHLYTSALGGGSGSNTIISQSINSLFYSSTPDLVEQSGSLAMSGSGLFLSGITGALNVLPNGSAYIISSDESVNITTGSSGQIDLTTVGGGGGGSFFFSETDELIEQSGSLAMSGSGLFLSGLTGALNVLSDGSPFITSNGSITVSTGSSGQITISTTPPSPSASGSLQAAYDIGGAIQLATNKPVAITGSVDGPMFDLLFDDNSNHRGITIKRNNNSQKTDVIAYLSGTTNFFSAPSISWAIQTTDVSTSQFFARNNDADPYALSYTFINAQGTGITKGTNNSNLILQTQNNNEILLRGDGSSNPFRFRIGSTNATSLFTSLAPVAISSSLTVASGITGALNVLSDGSPFIVSSDESLTVSTGSNGQIDIANNAPSDFLFYRGVSNFTSESFGVSTNFPDTVDPDEFCWGVVFHHSGTVDADKPIFRQGNSHWIILQNENRDITCRIRDSSVQSTTISDAYPANFGFVSCVTAYWKRDTTKEIWVDNFASASFGPGTGSMLGGTFNLGIDAALTTPATGVTILSYWRATNLEWTSELQNKFYEKLKRGDGVVPAEAQDYWDFNLLKNYAAATPPRLGEGPSITWTNPSGSLEIKKVPLVFR